MSNWTIQAVLGDVESKESHLDITKL